MEVDATYSELVTQQGGDPAQHQLDVDTWMQVASIGHDRVYGIGTTAHTRALLQPHGAGPSAFTSSVAGPSTSCADQDRLATVETAQACLSADMAAMRDTMTHMVHQHMQMAQYMTQMTQYMAHISSIIPGAPAPPPPPSFGVTTSTSDPSSSSTPTDMLPTQLLSTPPPSPLDH
ncbi:hypothetical protein Cni_G05867 [Canna indica]|uniref:Uncharacterized protein n=1 Tax=Canna indica TaxID=4628 RepID=A0AAQ3JVI0_9LILI|nr:hypothetical protein Cni_G05867 [Canna indica]